MKSAIVKITREHFIRSITDFKEDKFARTFVSKCDMMMKWHLVKGITVNDELCCAILTTHSLNGRFPKIANLQLLHTFLQHRKKGYAKILCNEAVENAWTDDCNYFRVSAEPEAKAFYEAIGFKFIGKQKKCYLSMFPLFSPKIEENKPVLDSVTEKAVYSKRKGGCVEIFPEAFL